MTITRTAGLRLRASQMGYGEKDILVLTATFIIVIMFIG